MAEFEKSVIEAVSVALELGEPELGLQIVRREDRRAELVEKGLDLIPVVCRYLGRKTTSDDVDVEKDEDDEDDYDGEDERMALCEEILIELAARGNPKEILIGLLEQADGLRDDIKFKSLLKPIQLVLERLPAKRGKSLEWVLSVLHSHVMSLPLPKSCNLEREERKLMDAKLDPNTRRIINVLSGLVSFYEPFVKEIALNSPFAREVKQESGILCHRNRMTFFLLQLLESPLVFLDLSRKSGADKNSVHAVAGKVIAYIKQLQSNFYNLFALYSQMYQPTKKLKMDKMSCTTDSFDDAASTAASDDKISDLSLATFFYLVLAEGVEFAHLPSVYSHVFVVESCLPFVNALLKRSEECVTQKGILLTTALFKRIRDRELGVSMLDFSEHLNLAQNLINVMLHSQVQQFRRDAVKLLQLYINKFDAYGRYHLIKCLLSSNEHAGVQGLLIQCFKNNLCESIRRESISSASIFVGGNLNAVLAIVTRLPEGPETDVLDQSDRILGALNLIRFLALRDQPHINITGFWNSVKKLEDDFLEPLRKALNLSRAHYQLELMNQIEEMSVGYRSRMKLAIPSDQSEQVLRLALNTFDMIDSVLGRTSEILFMHKRSSEMTDRVDNNNTS